MEENRHIRIDKISSAKYNFWYQILDQKNYGKDQA